MYKLISEDELAHYGIPGMKRGVRRWQYEDGRFNEEGKIRYFGTKNPRNKDDSYNGNKNNKAIDIKTAVNIINKNNFVVDNNKKTSISLINNLKKRKIDNEIKNRRKKENKDLNNGLYIQENKYNPDTDINKLIQDIKKVNPYNSLTTIKNEQYIKNTYLNCPWTAGTTVLRLAGYDAIANNNILSNNKEIGKGLSLKVNDDTQNPKAFYSRIFGEKSIKKYMTFKKNDGSQYEMLKDLETSRNESKNIISNLNKMKNGEVAIITLRSIYGGGHVANAKKINNKLYYIDGQNGQVKDFSKININSILVNSATIISLKDIKIDSNAANFIAHTDLIKEVLMSKLISEDELAHYGIPGMKRGVRRWQYEDGRFNEEGKIRYFGTKNPRNNDDSYNSDLNHIFNLVNTEYMDKTNYHYTYKEAVERYKQLRNDYFNKYSKEAKDYKETYASSEVIDNFKKNNKLSENAIKILDSIKNHLPNSIKNKLILHDNYKEIQKLYLNKNKYSDEEFSRRLNFLNNQRNIFRNVSYKQPGFYKKVLSAFDKNITEKIGKRLSNSILTFIFDDNFS